MSVKACASNLAQGVKELSVQWQETKSYWFDTKSHAFERKYLEELPGVSARTSLVMEEMDQLLTKVRADCE